MQDIDTDTPPPIDAPPVELHPDTATLLDVILRSLDDDQASDVVTLPLGEKSDLTDVMVVCSGRVARHVAAIAEHLVERARPHGFRPLGVSGLPAADWVVVDLNLVIVHVFRPDVRKYYDLESLWQDGVVPSEDQPI